MFYDVTIAVPVYNVSPYVKRCLSSIFAQTIGHSHKLEILIIDDCSTDDSMTVVESILPRCPSHFTVRIVRHSQNRGLAEARNTAIKEARGKFIWFVDSDDYVDPSMLQLMIESVDEETDVVICNVSAVDITGKPIDIGITWSNGSSWTGLEALELLYSRRIYAFMWNKLVRRSLYEGLVFPPGKTYEDLAIMGAILLRARRVAHIPQGLYYYVIRANSITAEYKDSVTDLIDSINFGIELVAEKQPELAVSARVQDYIVRSAWIPVINSVAKAPLPYRDTIQTVRTVQQQITLNSLHKLFVGRHFISLIVAILIRVNPRSYMGAYKILLLSRKLHR